MAKKKKTAPTPKKDYHPLVYGFAARLKDERVRHGLKQSELAKKAGLNVSYIGRLESAVRSPGIDTAAKLAEALEISVHDLLSTDEPEPVDALRDGARKAFEDLLRKADRPTLNMLVPLLITLRDAQAYKRRSAE